jgi:hypothetical protein
VADLIDENAEILAELESLGAGILPAQAQIITKVDPSGSAPRRVARRSTALRATSPAA